MSEGFSLQQYEERKIVEHAQETVRRRIQIAAKQRAADKFSTILKKNLKVKYSNFFEGINSLFYQKRKNSLQEMLDKRSKSLSRIEKKSRARTIDPYAQYSRARILKGIYDQLKAKNKIKPNQSQWNMIESRIRYLQKQIKMCIIKNQQNLQEESNEMVELMEEWMKLKKIKQKKQKHDHSSFALSIESDHHKTFNETGREEKEDKNDKTYPKIKQNDTKEETHSFKKTQESRKSYHYQSPSFIPETHREAHQILSRQQSQNITHNPITIHQQPVSIQHNIYNINPNHRPITQYKSQDNRFIHQLSPRNPVTLQQPPFNLTSFQMEQNPYKRRENAQNSNQYISSKGDRLSPVPKCYQYGSRQFNKTPPKMRQQLLTRQEPRIQKNLNSQVPRQNLFSNPVLIEETKKVKNQREKKGLSVVTVVPKVFARQSHQKLQNQAKCSL